MATNYDEEGDESSRRGFFARVAELLASVFSLRVVVALAASSTVTGAVAGPLAAKAFEARAAEAATSEVAAPAAPTTAAAETPPVASSSKPPTASNKPPASPARSSTTTSSSSTTTSAPTSSTATTFGDPAVTLNTAATTTTAEPSTTTPTTATPTTVQPTTEKPTTTEAPTTTTPAYEGLMVEAEAFPDLFVSLPNTIIWEGARIVFRGPPGTTSVSFWLDSAPPVGPTTVDNVAPFDFFTAADGSNFFDTTQLTNGTHEMTVIATYNGTTIEETWPFIVNNFVPTKG